MELAIPVLESTIPILESGIPILEKPFPILEWAIPVLERPFPILESTIPILEWVFPKLESAIPILESPFPSYLLPIPCHGSTGAIYPAAIARGQTALERGWDAVSDDHFPAVAKKADFGGVLSQARQCVGANVHVVVVHVNFPLTFTPSSWKIYLQ